MDDLPDIAARLEMLLVLQWLDEGRPGDGAVLLSIATVAAELDLSGEQGLLQVMGALSLLEGSKRASVTWPLGPGAEARVCLAEGIRRDARHLFGGDAPGLSA